jgi:glycosylphosphatidylinositol transamidase (GPIT) subunit GPI8
MNYTKAFIFTLLFYVSYSQKAIVVSSSIGYYNYRQTANALKVYHKLK